MRYHVGAEGEGGVNVQANSTEEDLEIRAQAEQLKRGIQAVVPENGLEDKLALSKREKRPLRIKLGLDPTAPDIHLGFAVVLRKLRQFQDMGHQVVIIIGDYTALIGDPSGRSATRPMLSAEEIKKNAETYVDQLARILQRERTEVRFNGEWLGKLDFAEVVKLAAHMTVAQVLQRDDFANRFGAHQPISLHELLYPLAQAYDSVAIRADIEMGGQDQTFNILAGRDLQREMGQAPQAAMFMPLLVGLDGHKKMSKSLGNYVGISEDPVVMFSKIMSLSDEAMKEYFVLCTDVPLDEVEMLLAESTTGRTNPRDVKRRLAKEIVTIYHGDAPSVAADDEWMRVHSAGEVPQDMPVMGYDAAISKAGTVWVCKLLVTVGLATGTGEARRLVQQGAVSVNGEKVPSSEWEPQAGELDGTVLKVGAKRYVKLQRNSQH